MAHVLLLHLDEPEGVLASDALGNLDDLRVEPGIVAPGYVTAWTGRGRSFDGATQALLAPDLSELGTLLTRDVTIQALISLNLDGVAAPMTAIARGVNDGSVSERYAYGLELAPHPTEAGLVLVRWFWSDYAGAIQTAPAGVFRSPGNGKEFMLTATRRWESSDRVVVRYYVNDQRIAELVTAAGDISGGTTGTTTIGARKDTGAWERWFKGTLDELVVADFEMSLEEVRHVWRRLTEYQPGAVETFGALAPVGLNWAELPYMSKLVKVVGQAHGTVVAEAEELRAMWLPPVATLESARAWEAGLKLSTKPRDSLDQRRARLIAYGSRLQGFSIPAVLQAVAPLLAATPDQLEVLEYDNIVTDGFDTFDTETKWLTGDVGAWAAAGGTLDLVHEFTDDIRWSVVGNTCHARIGIDTGETGRFYASAKIAAYDIAEDAEVGIVVENRVTGQRLLFGIRNEMGLLVLGWRKAGGAWNPVGGAFAGPVWLRVHNIVSENGIVPANPTWLEWSTSGPNSGFDTELVSGIAMVQWVGFGANSTAAPLAGDTTASFDDFLAYAPDGLRSFAWYIYRDPALPGIPDVNQAVALIKRMKPGHTFGGFTQAKVLPAGDTRDGLTSRGPLGRW